ncbi:MAG: hypothetical protein U0166_04435 [Acidobacteriota bacterium]
MELGYNTDIVYGGEAFHIQTEGRVQKNPRIETLVYKRGVILQKLAIADPELTDRGEGLEETKRKIRQQHLMAVSFVQRGELDKLDRIRDLTRLQDPFAGMDDGARGYVRKLWKVGPRALADELLALGRRRVLREERAAGGDADERHLEDALAYFVAHLADEDVPFYKKQMLVNTLLKVDEEDRLFDRYQALCTEEGAAYPPLQELSQRLCAATNHLIEILFQQSRKGSALADDLLFTIFTRQSLAIVRHLFEEAEKKFVSAPSGDRFHRNILPVVLLVLEDKFLKEPPSEKEVADILERLNTLYARLDVKTFQEIGTEIARIRAETGRPSPVPPEQQRKIQVYKGHLESAVREVKAGGSLGEKLTVLNRWKEQIDSWDRLLMLDVDLRLALKAYHNAVTDVFQNRAQSLAAELADAIARRPSRSGRLLLATLDGAIRDRENMGRIVGRALRAEAYLATLRKADVDRTLTRPEVRRELERITRTPGQSGRDMVTEIGKLPLGRRDQLLVAMRILESARLPPRVREELERLSVSRYPEEILMQVAEKLREAVGPPPFTGITRLEDAIEAKDGAWLKVGGADGHQPEIEIGFEAPRLQRAFFPDHPEAARLVASAMKASGFAAADGPGRAPAYALRHRVPRPRGTEEDAPRGARYGRDGRGHSSLKRFEMDLGKILSSIQDHVGDLERVSGELIAIRKRLEAVKAGHRVVLQTDRRLGERVTAFEAALLAIVDPLTVAARKATARGMELVALMPAPTEEEDRRRDLCEMLAELFVHDMTVGLGSYLKLLEDLTDVLDNTLPRGEGWDVIDVARFQYLLVAKGFPPAQVMLLLAYLNVNDRFFVDQKGRKLFRCKTERIARAVEAGLY